MGKTQGHTEETVLEIDMGALAHNYQYLRSKLKPDTKLMGVVKAYGYGSDATEVAKELAVLGIDYLAVAYSKEGEVLRNEGIATPILVLHPLSSNFEVIIDRCLEPNIYSVKILEAFISHAEATQQRHYPIHIKFNTGLNRLGFQKQDIPTIVSLLSQTESVRIKSIFSHLAASEDPNEKSFTLSQIAAFKTMADLLTVQLGYRSLFHVLNTSGILNFPEAQFNMVRSGIGLYGFGNDSNFDKDLKPIATLKTIISQIHQLKEGESLGYNRGFVASGEIRTATLPLGHADGISRIYGKGAGWVSIRGKKAPILGNVCMDMIMVDVSTIDCREGDEVIVFGPHNTAHELATHANTISYELVTAISQRVKRVFIKSSSK